MARGVFSNTDPAEERTGSESNLLTSYPKATVTPLTGKLGQSGSETQRQNVSPVKPCYSSEKRMHIPITSYII